ncbi:ArsR family transcriptional regulator [Anopheles sinensis]|uniref:ArsR family transcriptional regulator n=1 Tax=Anopheles sinensis TaxID=74873 RepID=A0A084VCR1_ANOSI|nr:ArsR family transcriptional regulator [Anopheles sinensis]
MATGHAHETRRRQYTFHSRSGFRCDINPVLLDLAKGPFLVRHTRTQLRSGVFSLPFPNSSTLRNFCLHGPGTSFSFRSRRDRSSKNRLFDPALNRLGRAWDEYSGSHVQKAIFASPKEKSSGCCSQHTKVPNRCLACRRSPTAANTLVRAKLW